MYTLFNELPGEEVSYVQAGVNVAVNTFEIFNGYDKCLNIVPDMANLANFIWANIWLQNSWKDFTKITAPLQISALMQSLVIFFSLASCFFGEMLYDLMNETVDDLLTGFLIFGSLASSLASTWALYHIGGNMNALMSLFDAVKYASYAVGALW
jgi:hypothetical protein